ELLEIRAAQRERERGATRAAAEPAGRLHARAQIGVGAERLPRLVDRLLERPLALRDVDDAHVELDLGDVVTAALAADRREDPPHAAHAAQALFDLVRERGA